MSATNETSTIGLSQYISTDKPTYLVDYNGDMLKIDNAIAADRGSIADVNTVAERADGKADTNKTSIDTLNEQINGNPEDPADTGLAGKVTDNSGDIDTIEALIGNGTPTTSNQTIIGAINGLEGAIAPREDGVNLANNYAIGEQFARGGSVYTALVSLTADTPFASLTLNTDYKNSDTIVEQLADVKETIYDGLRFGALKYTKINADGVKNHAELCTDLLAAFNTARSGKPVVVISCKAGSIGTVPALQFSITPSDASPSGMVFSGTYGSASAIRVNYVILSSTTSELYRVDANTTPAVVPTSYGSDVPAEGTEFGISYYEMV